MVKIDKMVLVPNNTTGREKLAQQVGPPDNNSNIAATIFNPNVTGNEDHPQIRVE